MKKTVVTLLAIVLALGSAAHATSVEATLEQALLLRLADKLELQDFELVEVLQGYKEYREMMDTYTEQRAEKKAAIEAALEGNEGSSAIMALTRDLMNIDMNIMRLKQSSVNEASSVMGAKAVAELYLLVSDLDKAKADLVAELTGASASAACPLGMPAGCPMAAAAGCAAAAPAVAPEQAIMERVMLFLNKLAAKEVDAALEGVLPSFDHHEFGDKEGLKFFLEQAIAMGYLDDIRIKTDDTEIKIDGDKAIVYPIDIEGMFGTVTLELIGKVENGTWMLSEMDAFGI